MASSGKFGTFGGVFTPSILTILGVIMYLRLPWIVGQAGLVVTLAIIIVAHIISVTTGLSVSSIATDKKVKVGGNYYIISRSLGLPIGGTLGIALFVGLSFSVSLYIIGFIESFLPAIGVSGDINNIRLYGTIAVILVTIIVLISTSLAIKSQYLIMAAIVASLVSIFLGQTPESAASVSVAPGNEVSLMMLFGIFFPAVTGFTAGVQMSGDLKDPKKSLPSGTMLSIIIGFIIYIGLAIFFSLRVPVEQLVNNPTVLQDISLVPSLLFAGIWGATLSSAMGSLLGAPRILQATSMDRITPKIFGKGYGPGNEPRNALVLTFIIAEVGILIGELNIIAAIISTFFITTYGFINLSCAIENWASPDFHPSFRIPTWISAVGAFSCFLVMIELDLLSFAGATLILGILFVYLKRKELTLESGDTWSGVWTSLIRSGLHKLTNSETVARNWNPNVILFSGGSENRPHLLELGQWLVARRGMLSDFQLIENPQKKVLFTKSGQLVSDEANTRNGIYSRKLECRNIYEGMETIAQVYGFSGIEPNTILMGWARNSREPENLVKLFKHMKALDYNVLMLDYDKERGFGDKSMIDLWWRGGSNIPQFTLILLKFIKSSEEWREAQTRINIVVNDGSLVNRVYKNVSQLISDERIEAEIRVINNAIEQRNIVELIREKSYEADLIMMGIPELIETKASGFVESINRVLPNIGSTILVKASKFFPDSYIGIDRDTESAEPKSTELVSAEIDFSGIEMPDTQPGLDQSHERISREYKYVCESLQTVVQQYMNDGYLGVNRINAELISEFEELIERNLSSMIKLLEQDFGPKTRKTVQRLQGEVFFHLSNRFEEFRKKSIADQRNLLELAVQHLHEKFGEMLSGASESVNVYFTPEQVRALSSDAGWFKFKNNLLYTVFKKQPVLYVSWKRFLEYLVQATVPTVVRESMNAFGFISYQFQADLQKWFKNVADALAPLPVRADEPEKIAERVKVSKSELLSRLNEIISKNMTEIHSIITDTNEVIRNELSSGSLMLSKIKVNNAIRRRQRAARTQKHPALGMKQIPDAWFTNFSLLTNFTLIDLQLQIYKHRVSVLLNRLQTDLEIEWQNKISSVLQNVRDTLDGIKEKVSSREPIELDKGHVSASKLETDNLFTDLRKDLQKSLAVLEESIDIIDESSFQSIETNHYSYLEVNNVAFQKLVHFLTETELVEPLLGRMRDLETWQTRVQMTSDDVYRLLEFQVEQIGTEDVSDEDFNKSTFSALINSRDKQLAVQEKEIEEQLEEAKTQIGERRTLLFDKLNPYLMTKSVGEISQYIRVRESQKVISDVESHGRNLKKLVNNFIVRAIYRRSESVLWANKLRGNSADEIMAESSALAFLDQLMPESEVTDAVPFFYSQLFAGKQPISNDYFVGREKEISRADKALERYRHGFTGGLLILGDVNSGKTTFSNYIARNNFKSNLTFRIMPVEGGSTDFEKFLERLRDATGINETSVETIFRRLPENTCILINDLEMWWERNVSGGEALVRILDLVQKFSHQCLFIINMSLPAYSLIKQLFPLHEVFMATIDCQPFNAREIQEAVLLRHYSSGFHFSLDGVSESELSKIRRARLFNQLFDFCEGNIGLGLHTWLAGIERIKGREIGVRRPHKYSGALFNDIDSETRTWLRQFLYHKQLTIEKAARIFMISEKRAEQKLADLLHRGYLQLNGSQVYMLNVYLAYFIAQQFTERDKA